MTARFYHMEYQSSDKKSRETFLPGIRNTDIQQMLKLYRKSEEQIRLLEYTAWNGELLGKANKAEFYYRQLITYDRNTEDSAYLEFGNFLNRYRGDMTEYGGIQRMGKKTDIRKKTTTVG